MAFRIEEFKCGKCEREQEQLISNTDKRAEDECKYCSAPKEELEPLMSASTSGSSHISWSKWRV